MLKKSLLKLFYINCYSIFLFIFNIYFFILSITCQPILVQYTEINAEVNV